MTKRRPLALGAAAAIGFGSLFFATPAAFAQEEVEQPIVDQTEEQAEVALDAEALTAIESVEDLEAATGASAVAFGTGADGETRILIADKNDPQDVKEEVAAAVESGEIEGFDEVAFADPAKPYAATDVVGGAAYQSFDSNDNLASGCSFGFPAWTGAGDPAVITAGHCSSDSAMVGIRVAQPTSVPAGGAADWDNTSDNGTGEFGAFGFSQYGGPGHTEGEDGNPTSTDIGVIDVVGDDFNLIPAVTDWSTADQEDLAASLATPITGVANPVEGGVSKSGGTTGLTSGDTTVDMEYTDGSVRPTTILDGYMPIGGRWVHGFLSDAHGQPGDSGGAVFQGDKAVGIVSGGPDDGSFLWATRLQDGLQQVPGGYEVAFHIDAPAVTSHEDGAPLAPGETITGSAPANATDVSLSLAEGTGSIEPVEGGEWSTEAPSEPGDYTLSFSATNGYNRSETQKFNFTVEAAAVAAPAITSPANGSTVEAPVTEITGTGVAGATLNMTGDVTSEVEVGEDGNWSVPTDLAEGEYTVLVTQTVEGETSREVTSSFTVVKKDEPPVDKVEIAVTSIEDGAEYTLANAPTSVSGTATPGATVTGSLDADNGEFKAVADAKGNWSADLGYKPALGAYTLEATASLDGETSKTVTVDFTIVESNGSGGGGDDNGKGNGGGDDDLAATGFDIVSMAPYIAGAALMALLGAAAILVAARRQKGLTDES